jgi:hypothetical protein
MVYVMVFLAALGTALLLWCLMGLLLVPVFGENMVTFCMASGDGKWLEQKARGYNWLREGRKSGGRFVIADCGLTSRGRQIAERLCGRYDWVELYNGELPKIFQKNGGDSV